ncbi:branched-chain amino acid ABC transporter permease [Microvirga massiliensis]|uniref:branched-chain amino acid ABC transporter permease n=1 Tax=Microvirga massiliensis TaxID=1033741 RepID=UPI00062B980B|nr:branched-chain amino acid ABC transporter permease [Microvirga massiliensis]
MLALDLAFQGLITGVFYALMAIGLSLIFGILRIVNFAHGEFYMVGAYAFTLVALALGVDPWLALVAAPLLGALLGWITERLLIRPLYAGYSSWGIAKDEYAIIVTFALSLLLINLVDKVVGPYPMRGPSLVEAQRLRLGPFMMSGHRLTAAIVGSGVIIAVFLFMRFSFWGKQIQAVSQNRLGASLAGIDPSRVSMLVFAASGALAALAGALLAPLINASPDVGLYIATKSYVIVVLGGMGSIGGALIASLLLGILESFAAVYISYDYRDTFGLAILILVLLFRPQGLLGQRVREV